MVTAKFSNNYQAIQSRIRRLPKMYGDTLEAVQKGDANRLVVLFREGVLMRQLRLRPLKEETIRRKARQGKPAPETPLHGMGELEENSYANMMHVVEEKVGKGKRWRVLPREDQHHESELTLRALFDVHEFGAVIIGAHGQFIRIPPRPAMRYAFRKLMRERANRDTNTAVRDAISRFVQRGDARALSRVKEKAEKWSQ